MYKTGEQVFIPRYGAGTIMALKEKENFNSNYNYMVINLLLGNMKLYIPQERIKFYNIRKISSKEAINNALAVIEQDNKIDEDNWIKRYRNNKAKMLTGDIVKIAEVIRDLSNMKNEELMPHGEEKILEEAQNMMASEIMIIFNVNFDTACDLLKKS